MIRGFSEALLEYWESFGAKTVSNGILNLKVDVLTKPKNQVQKSEITTEVKSQQKEEGHKRDLDNELNVALERNLSNETTFEIKELKVKFDGKQVEVLDFKLLNEVLRKPEMNAEKILQQIEEILEKIPQSLGRIQKWEQFSQKSR